MRLNRETFRKSIIQGIFRGSLAALGIAILHGAFVLGQDSMQSSAKQDFPMLFQAHLDATSFAKMTDPISISEINIALGARELSTQDRGR